LFHKTSIFVILSLILVLPIIAQSEAFLQTGGRLEQSLEPGDIYSYEWALKSELDKPVTVSLRAEGEAAELFSFPKSLDLQPGEWSFFDIVITIPEDYPNDVLVKGSVIALLLGEPGGQVTFNVQMKKNIILTIGDPIIEEAVAEEKEITPSKQPQVEETKEEQPQEKGTFSVDLDSQPEAEQTQESTTTESEEGGGCLISTATYGSELAPQVQMLREIRDNSLLTTSTGSAFMTGFNTLYYSFSPTIADWERQSPIFQEAVKISITPLITSLSILNYVDMDSEAEVLGYGIGIILLNIGMYFVAPAAIILRLKR